MENESKEPIANYHQLSQPKGDETETSPSTLSIMHQITENQVQLDGFSGMEVDSQGSDADSAIGESTIGSSTTSLRASVMEYIEENGRTYHAYKSGSKFPPSVVLYELDTDYQAEYVLPNDEAEQDRLDLQHHLFLLSLGSLHLAPLSETPHNVLDIGTGTGIWAIEFAQQYPSASVLGTDLSPIQPDYVPPNCHFEVNDFEDEWNFAQKFDYVHGRALTATIKHPGTVIKSAYDALKPGGWLEIQDPTMPFLSIDDTMEGTAVQQWMQLICTAGEKLGRSWTNSRNYKNWMADVGFGEIHEVHFPWPLSPWPKGKKQKLVSLWMQQDLLDGLQGFSLALLTKGLGWTAEAVEMLLVDVRKDITNRHIHAYCDVLVTYGRKPL